MSSLSWKESVSDILLKKGFKFTFTICMSMIALSRYFLYGDYIHEICMIAVFISTLADIILMDYNQIPSYYLGKHTFYYGMAVFMVSHLTYMYCFYTIMGKHFVTNVGTILGIISFVLIEILAVFYVCKNQKTFFKSMVAMYILFISLNMIMISTCSAMLGGQYKISVIGIICFIISDFFILLRETIHNPPVIVKKLVWIFYPIGQLLIIFSI